MDEHVLSALHSIKSFNPQTHPRGGSVPCTGAFGVGGERERWVAEGGREEVREGGGGETEG